ncbi:MAG TPA: hypothetical protein EYN72_07780 [Dehalococcoidia bacterium]|nr:hypothetical protein [Dehalococcoidia bacterium]
MPQIRLNDRRDIGGDHGESNLICIDMGGTSFDVSLIRHGEVGLKSEFDLQGLPILAPAVELISIALKIPSSGVNKSRLAIAPLVSPPTTDQRLT